MRDINITDKTVTFPVQVYTVDKGNIVGIKTNTSEGTECLTFIRTGQPQIGSVVDDIETNGDLVALVSTSDSSVV